MSGVLLFVAVSVGAQVTTSSAPMDPPTAATSTISDTAPATATAPTSVAPVAESAASAPDRVSASDLELAVLRERVENVTRVGGWVAFFATLLTIPSLIVLYRSERRSGEAHALGMAGEGASQQRAAEVHAAIFEASKNTLNLVNETLQLAKDASARAAEAVLKKARQTLLDLDEEARELLESAPAGDDRFLVTDLEKRSELRSIARRIAGFEAARVLMPEDIDLTPPCLFVRGMDFHLDQQYLDAIRTWKKVALDEHAPLPLRSLSWYWIGYEHNNLANFGAGEESFTKALETAHGVRRFELQRIKIESAFFNTPPEQSADGIIESLAALAASTKQYTETNPRPALAKILITLGNVRSQAALRADEESAKRLRMDARAAFEEALAIRPNDKWALFGVAEMAWALGDHAKATAAFEQVRVAAEREAIDREEPRTKVLARTTELICCVHVPSMRDDIPVVRNHVTEALGRVDGRLTVYSQMLKRNVSKDDFRRQLAALESPAM